MLRSVKDLESCVIQATDGLIGHVKDPYFDDQGCLVVNTSAWWFGHQVLIAPQWIQDISWPTYDAAVALSREYEESLYKHHGRTSYWTDEAKRDHPEARASRT
jgi:hypothetical protein